MKLGTVPFVVLLVLLAGTCHGGNNNYTWKDAHGTLNITDYPPPEDAEIIDISPIPSPPAETVPAAPQSQGTLQEQNTTRNQLLAEAAALRKEEETLRLRAAELNAEAEELRSRSAIQKVKRRYRRWARGMDQEAADLISRADSLAGKAQALETKAAQIR